ncbi:acylneuraminate cytidylyltransferase family protein [Adlercreutzia mucosicola]|uniref:acylneuraminate cytidylyltransferase family protein n=2 Tax=Adlercreutzia mucosicola TaxID=580026 RepID=UPI00041617F0|nr:acylneuraminate cytidylyltransferase family protein [Adlercreutzia mucosicola]
MARINCECMAVIPARSGSKGLPGKNVKELCGKPLLAWTIEAALGSGCFDKVLVSTDSPDYGAIAEAWGAEVVYRDQRLATSSATTFMVLEDLLHNKVCPSKLFTLLQPTSPLRTASQIADAMRLITLNFAQYDFVASVSLAEHASHLVHPLAADGSLALFDIDYSNYRRQDSAEYSPNGAIFIAKPDEYLAQGHFFGARSLAYVMDKESSVDIDDDIDFALAELCMTRRLIGR